MPVKKKTIWIAVADGGGYRIFSCSRLGGPMVLVHEAKNPEGQIPTNKLGSDRPGRSRGGPGQGRHAFQNKADWHTKAEMDFAKSLGNLLAKRYREKSFTKLLLVAPAKILGEIRTHLEHIHQDKNLKTLAKDLTHQKLHELQDYLDKEF